MYKTVAVKLIFKYFFVFFFLMSTAVYAQPDSEKKTIKIPAKETKEKDSTQKKLKISPKGDYSLTKKKNNIGGIPLKNKVKVIEQKEQFSMFSKSELRNPGELFEKRLNQKSVEQGIKIPNMADQFLGQFNSNGDFVNIICRDHEFPDGDVVQVRVNDDIIIPRLLLTSGYKSFNIGLEEGINKIDFLALNQGDSGPNTAEFQVYNDKGELVSSKKWNLLTGVKATIIVTKEAQSQKQ